MTTQRFLTGLLVVVTSTVTACGGPRELKLSASPDIPAASATAKVSKGPNGNTDIDLVVKHLAAPSRISSDATIYLVWVRGNEPGARAQNLGALEVDNDLNGNLKAVTPLRSFQLYITAEASRSSAAPTGRALLYTTVSMR